jgi:hypothetical protein
MIGSMTEHVAGENAGPGSASFKRARQQFITAARNAVGKGAKVILLAAATKRLFESGELEEVFPGVVFTLGDNMTGLLLVKMIRRVYELTGMDLKSSVLVIGPYGLLGGVASHYLTKIIGAKVVGLGNPKRRKLLEEMSEQLGIIPAYSYNEVNEVGKIDLVVACNSSKAVVLTQERMNLIRRAGRKLIVIDPAEPYALSEENYCTEVIRFDSGNGYSDNLRYVPFPFGMIMHRLLRLSAGVTWGCFCETMILAKHIKNTPKLENFSWFDITLEQMKIMEHFFGSGPGKFDLPKPSCFSRCFSYPIKIEM